MEPRKAIGWLAALVIAVGVILLLIPVSTAAGTGCGSVLNSSDTEAIGEEFGHDAFGFGDAGQVEACGSRRGVQAGIGWGIVAVGALVGGYLMLTNKGRPVESPAPVVEPDVT